MCLIDALEDGQIDALAFTSRIQVDNLLSIAAQAGKEESLRGILAQGSTVVASVALFFAPPVLRLQPANSLIEAAKNDD